MSLSTSRAGELGRSDNRCDAILVFSDLKTGVFCPSDKSIGYWSDPINLVGRMTFVEFFDLYCNKIFMGSQPFYNSDFNSFVSFRLHSYFVLKLNVLSILLPVSLVLGTWKIILTLLS